MISYWYIPINLQHLLSRNHLIDDTYDYGPF